MILNIRPEGLTSPLQLYQALQLNISSRLTGDEDLTFSLPEDLKYLFFLFITGFPCGPLIRLGTRVVPPTPLCQLSCFRGPPKTLTFFLQTFNMPQSSNGRIGRNPS